MTEVRVRGSVDASTIYRTNPFVHVTTVKGIESIWPPRNYIEIRKRHPYAKELECELIGELVEERGVVCVVKLKSEGTDIQVEIPCANLVTKS